MSSPFESLVKMSAGLMEAGIMAMYSGAKTLQDGLESLNGPKSNGWQKNPPLSGPPNVDSALSDFANQLVKIGRRTRPAAASAIST